MNIDDFELTEDINPVNYTKLIFNRQRELIEKYLEIERKNGYYHPGLEPINIDSRKDQAFLKDMYERCIEEIGESLEAYLISKDEHHAKEELIDSLHFIVELCITAGIQEDIENTHHYIVSKEAVSTGQLLNFLSDIIRNFIMTGGIAMNNLKQKPWKCTEVPTDEKKFKSDLKNAYLSHKAILNVFMSDEEILQYYFKKSKVNQFRQQSNY